MNPVAESFTPTANRKLRFAFVVSQSWFTKQNYGGAEKQIYHLAKALVEKGHSVDVFSMDTDSAFTSAGVRVLPAWNRKKGIPKLRYMTYRIPCLLRKLKHGGYDVVYSRGFADHASAISLFKGYHGARSMIALASNANLFWPLWRLTLSGRSRFKVIQEWFKHIVYRNIALRHADVIVSQNDIQMKAAAKYSRTVKHLPSIYIPHDRAKSPEKSCDVVWIGGLRPAKGVDELLTILEKLPELSFCVIGRTSGARQNYYEGVFSDMSNVTYFRYLSNERVHTVLERSRLLLNTSHYEGFPNTYLEAWFSGTPVVSLHADPDGLLEKESIGYCSKGDLEKLLLRMNDYLSNPTFLKEAGVRAHKYVAEKHSKEVITESLEKLLSGLS